MVTIFCGRGYALIAALIAVAIGSLAVSLAVSRAQVEAQREREAQLLFVGGEYRRAIVQYYGHPPLGQPNQFPAQLADLVEDTRGVSVQRWLRRLYPDPMTGAGDWELDVAQGRIIGLHSRSDVAPIRHGNFEIADAGFAGAVSYREWRFDAAAAIKSLAAQSALAPAQSKPTVPGDTPTDPNARHNAQVDCDLAFALPALNCDEPVPPAGHDRTSCQSYFQEKYQQCLAAIP